MEFKEGVWGMGFGLKVRSLGIRVFSGLGFEVMGLGFLVEIMTCRSAVMETQTDQGLLGVGIYSTRAIVTK